MIDGLQPYPEYKASGLPWSANIPAHWEVARNGRLFAQ
jgi:type I restriction enzyme, S subunit